MKRPRARGRNKKSNKYASHSKFYEVRAELTIESDRVQDVRGSCDLAVRFVRSLMLEVKFFVEQM